MSVKGGKGGELPPPLHFICTTILARILLDLLENNSVMSLEIRPLAASLSISALSGRLGRYDHAYGIYLRHFLFHQTKKIYMGWGV